MTVVFDVLLMVCLAACGGLLACNIAYRKENRELQAELDTARKTPYQYASLNDRFAERAMQVLMKQHAIRAGSLDMDLNLVATGAYKMSAAMLSARKKG